MTTVTLPRRLARPFSGLPDRRGMLIGFLVTLGVGLVMLTSASLAVGLASADRALPGVRVGGVELAGLGRAEAEARLVAELPSLAAGRAVVTAGDDEFIVPYADLGRGYEMDAMLDAAFATGRDGALFGDAVARLRSLVHATELPVVVHAYDPAALEAAAIEIARSVSYHPAEATVTRDGTAFRLHRSQDGRLLEASAVGAALGAAVDTPDPADVRVELAVSTIVPIVDTAMATAAKAAAEGMVDDLALSVTDADDEEAPLVTSAQIASWISFGPQGADDYVARIDEAALFTTVAQLADEVDREPVDARITVAAGGGLGGVIDAVDGRELQVDEAVASLMDTLRSRAAGASVPTLALPVLVTEPTLTTDEALEILPQMQLVSSWTTYYVSSDGNGFGNNISIGAWDLDGYNIAPGEWFSFWGGIGPVTLERGYRYGGAIINGRSVPNGALAGGICSTSTTLFNAAMRFGLEIGERENHFYYIDRYPTGLDATVAIVNDDVTDMTFRNDTEHPIVIRGFGSPGQVTFQMWSVPNGRTVALGAPIISNRRSAIETTQVDPSMAPGTAKRVEYPHHGFDASVSRTVYASDGAVIHQDNWFSDYRPVNGITLVGPPS
jgi:vancomycin resistance protein YoaR